MNAEVTIELSGGVEIIAIITKQSAQQMELGKGKPVHAVIKASDVMVATD